MLSSSTRGAAAAAAARRVWSCRLEWCQRAFSSASNALTTMEDEEDSFMIRPRLHALRRKLEQEQPADRRLILSSSSSPKTKSLSKKTAKNDILVSPPKNGHELNRLLEQLDTLPLPEKPLQDKFGREHSYLRISLSEKCNLRCLYCMPEDGVPVQPESYLLSNSEIVQLATWFVQHGVTKIRLTGGEPLLRKDLVDLVAKLRCLDDLEQIGMTTNGVTLSRHLPDLVAAGMTHVNISLDSLQADKFARLTRRPPSYHARVLQAIEDCAKWLPNRTKINCVVLPDNVDELQAFCELTREMPVDIRFIEYMPFNDNQWQTDGFVSYQLMQDQIQGLKRIQDGPNDTTKWWTLEEGDEEKEKDASTTSSSSMLPSRGRIGFITSMSEHFCGTCNRLRITADGQLKVCLFGKTEVSLRDLLRQQQQQEQYTGGEDRSHERLQKVIHYAVQRKHYKLGGHKDMQDLQAHSTENRPMTLIGG